MERHRRVQSGVPGRLRPPSLRSSPALRPVHAPSPALQLPPSLALLPVAANAVASANPERDTSVQPISLGAAPSSSTSDARPDTDPHPLRCAIVFALPISLSPQRHVVSSGGEDGACRLLLLSVHAESGSVAITGFSRVDGGGAPAHHALSALDRPTTLPPEVLPLVSSIDMQARLTERALLLLAPKANAANANANAASSSSRAAKDGEGRGEDGSALAGGVVVGGGMPSSASGAPPGGGPAGGGVGGGGGTGGG